LLAPGARGRHNSEPQQARNVVIGASDTVGDRSGRRKVIVDLLVTFLLVQDAQKGVKALVVWS
jgi:hypothetical protein